MGKNKKEKPSRPAPKPTPAPVQPCKQCTITSETKATSPEDRARTRIAVGEEVTLTVSPGPADWVITNGTGGLVGSDDKGRVANVTSVTFNADDNGGSETKSVTITATGSCGTCTITFTVVAPSHWTMRREAGTVLKHTQGRPTCGFIGRPYIHPNDVNFYRIDVREKDSHPQGTGCYSGPAIEEMWHGNYPPPDRVSPSRAIDDHTSNHGSRVDTTDHIGGDDPGPLSTGVAPPFTTGRLTFPIVWQWRVHFFIDDWYDFPTVNQKTVILETGECETTKGWHTEATQYTDPTGTPF